MSDDVDTFVVSPAGGYLMIGIGIVFCVVPFLPGTAGDIPPTSLFWYFSPFWLSAFIAAVFLFRYRVVVRDQTLSYGAFRRRVISFSGVIDFEVLRGQKSSELRVYLKDGERLKFSGMLSDFDELAGMINSHIGGLPGSQRDSAAKIHDQEKRKHDSQIVGGIVIIGTLIVALVAFMLWRMQLLH
jgi:hypothetical protein